MATRMIPYAQAIERTMRSSSESGVEYGVFEGEGHAGISVRHVYGFLRNLFRIALHQAMQYYID
jgi:hypothetical protein